MKPNTNHFSKSSFWTQLASQCILFIFIFHASAGLSQLPNRFTLKNINSLTFTADNKYVISSEFKYTNSFTTDAEKLNNKLTIWDLANGNNVRTISYSGPQFMSFSHDNKYALAETGIYKLENQESYKLFDEYTLIKISRDSKIVIAKSKDYTDRAYYLINVDDKKIISIINTPDNGHFFKAVDISPDNKYLVTGRVGGWGIVQLWDIHSGEMIREMTTTQNKQDISSVNFSHDGKYVVIGTSDFNNEIAISETSTGNLVRVLKPFNTAYDYLGSASISPNNNWLLTAHARGSLILWDFLNGNKVADLSSIASGVPAFSSNSYFIYGKGGNDATILNIKYYLVQYFYKNEIEKEKNKSSLFTPKSEFETTIQYNERVQKAMNFENDLLKKYELKFEEDYQTKGNIQRQKILASTLPITLRIEFVGPYNADKQYFPITVAGIKEIVKVPSDEAQSFKENYSKAKVTGFKRLTNNLGGYETYNIQITHPVKGTKYEFGRQELKDPGENISSFDINLIKSNVENVKGQGPTNIKDGAMQTKEPSPDMKKNKGGSNSSIEGSKILTSAINGDIYKEYLSRNMDISVNKKAGTKEKSNVLFLFTYKDGVNDNLKPEVKDNIVQQFKNWVEKSVTGTSIDLGSLNEESLFKVELIFTVRLVNILELDAYIKTRVYITKNGKLLTDESFERSKTFFLKSNDPNAVLESAIINSEKKIAKTLGEYISIE